MSNEPLVSSPAPEVASGDTGAPPRPHPLPEEPPVVEAGWRHTLAGGLARTARPKQWIKNVLVFA
ncbi:MAG: hypothetical protein M3357_06440, partial [Actinomycetota bacterium]|nr:hypothetical protein [Actinomycetota bacterium]